MSLVSSITAGTLRKALVVCGILSSLLYVGTDILAGTLWTGYSFTSQYISELSAIGAPTRPLVVALLIPYGILLVAFGLGAWESAYRRRNLRIVGAMLIGDSALGFVAYFFPIHLRGVESTLTDTMHIALTAMTVVFILTAMWFGAFAYRNWFRPYSIVTILMLIAPGILSFFAAPNVTLRQPTPWVGVAERITIYSYLVWVAVLAVVLLRTRTMPNAKTRIEETP